MMYDTSIERPIIRIRNLKKRFGDQVVLDGINLDIPRHSIFSILGRSGAGKSVLIKTIVDIITADSGEIYFEQENILQCNKKKKKKLLRNFAYLFQEAALFDSMSVKDNIAFPIREVLRIHDKKYIDARVKEILEWVELPNTEKVMPFELSGGMKKRASFARTIAMTPKVLLCDEPTTGLDPVTSRTISDLIIRANKELKITCVVITHDVPEALHTSDYIAFLDQGKLQVTTHVDSFLKSEYPLLQDFVKNAILNNYKPNIM